MTREQGADVRLPLVSLDRTGRGGPLEDRPAACGRSPGVSSDTAHAVTGREKETWTLLSCRVLARPSPVGHAEFGALPRKVLMRGRMRIISA